MERKINVENSINPQLKKGEAYREVEKAKCRCLYGNSKTFTLTRELKKRKKIKEIKQIEYQTSCFCNSGNARRCGFPILGFFSSIPSKTLESRTLALI